MILGILSDTHGNRALMRMAAADLMQRHHANLLLHLGDNYADGEELAAAGYPVRFVPGLWCDEYADGRVQNVLMDTYEEIPLACAHTHEDLMRGPGRDAAILCFGHTHHAQIELKHGKLLLNPGHLKARRDRGQRASYAVIRLEETAVTAVVYELDGLPRRELVAARGALLRPPATNP